jgi:DNA-binding CsgD family transcriptional regulator
LTRTLGRVDPAFTVPPSLRELLRGRLRGLSPSTRTLLLYAAAVGRPTASLLEGAVGDPEEAARALEEAAAADAIAFAGEEVRFSHPLLASVHYAAVTPRQRRDAHRRLAALVTDLEEHARHLALAGEPPDATVANALEEAAQRAFERGALDGAASLGEETVRFTPPERLDALQSRRLTAAGYLARAGSKTRARKLLDEARAAASSSVQKIRIALAFSWYGLADRRESVAELTKALADASGDLQLLAEIHAQLAGQLRDIDTASAADHASRAVALAERVGEPAALALALVVAADIDFYLGRGANGEQLARARMLEATTPNLYGDIGVARFAEAGQLLFTGELDAARRSLEVLIAESRERDDGGYAYFLRRLADVEIRAGRWERAGQLADESLAITREVGDDVGAAGAYTRLAQLAALRGDVADAEAFAEKGHLGGSGKATILASLGMLELSLGNARTARERLDETARLVSAIGLREPAIIPFVPDWVEALLLCNELDTAETAAADLEERGRRLARKLTLAGAARSQGLVAAARGDLAGAVARLEHASDQGSCIGQPFEVARTLLALGRVRRQAGRKTAAGQTLNEALSTFNQLGAVLWAARTAEELARIGGRRSAPGKLTPTEQQVAGLVSTGKSNHEAARALFMSPKTVEWHLSKIYRKLNVHSRAELAAKLALRPGELRPTESHGNALRTLAAD